MGHKEEFEKRKNADGALVDLFLFGWIDGEGNGDDYGLNDGSAQKTFTMLISTTYMFQPEPKFTLQCRKFTMKPAQFDYLQDHDLDTQEFLSSLGPLSDISYEVDLSQHADAASALEAMEKICQ